MSPLSTLFQGCHVTKGGVLAKAPCCDRGRGNFGNRRQRGRADLFVLHDFFPRDQETPEALARFQKAEIEKWWPIIKASGIRGE
jgi:hypothetical protein